MKKNIIIFIIAFGIVFHGCTSILKLNKTLEISENDRITLGGSNSRANFLNVDIPKSFQKVWDYEGPAGISMNQPLIADSIIFIGFMNGELHAINIITGKRIGKVSVDAPIHGSPVLTKNKIYIPLAHNKFSLRAYDFDEGTLLWKKEIDGIESSLLLTDMGLFAATESGTLFSTNIFNGKTLWEYKCPKKIRASLSGDNEKVYSGCDDGFLYAINQNNGKLIWKFFTGNVITAAPVIKNGKIFVGSYDDYFYSISADSGFMLWKFNSGAPIIGGAAIDDSTVYFGNLAGTLFALDQSSGELIWQYRTGSNLNSAPFVTKNHILVGSFDRKVRLLEKRSGNILWETTMEGRIKTTPIIWNNYLLICSEDYDITLFKF